MIHTAAPRSLRVGVAAVGIAGALALAGCAGTAAESADEPDTSSSGTGGSTDTTDSDSPASTGDTAYADGTYSAEGSYATPESVETISVTVTVEGDVVTDVEVSGNPQKRESEEYQSKFIGGIAAAVVGEDLDAVSVSRVAGSSLTSGGFNQAIETIKAEAAA
ncbi:hypothetical protein [Microbacterium pumilum]|uniref:FMN-binding domain-containing protein n=1 Tax=Microbacterium pumilum TaxID=344165 RepID=A0ABN2SW03_9MICO